MGPEPFREGVDLYLRQHAYANATASDFWNAQTQVSKKPVDKIMPTWTEQAGPPLVTVKTQCSGNSDDGLAGTAAVFLRSSQAGCRQSGAMADSLVHEGRRVSDTRCGKV